MAFDAGSVIGFLKLDIKGWVASQQKALKANEKFNQKLIKNGKATQEFGKSILKVGLGITAFMATTVKFASDNIEATSKFKRAFIGVEEEAQKMNKTLQNGYGLSSLESKRLLGNTGDLLKGFEATSEEALDFSFAVQKMSVDLASYNNVQGGAARASRILTKAALGNKEGLEELGAKVLDSDVALRLLEKDQNKLKGSALKLAKAYATLELITEQNKDAAGDFGRTQDQVANKTRVLKSEAINTAVSFGTHLIPMAKSVLNAFTGILKGITDWIKENPALSGMIIKTTAILGGLALVVGTVTVAVGLGMIAWGKLGLVLATVTNPAILAMGVSLKVALPWLAALSAGMLVAKVASEAFLGASKRAQEQAIKTGNTLGRTMREVTAYMKQASPIEQQIINDQINMMKSMGFSNEQIFNTIHGGLKKNTKKWKAWKDSVAKEAKDAKDKANESGNGIVKGFKDQNGVIAKAIETYKRLTLDQFSFRRFEAKKSFEENMQLLKDEKAGEEEFLILKKSYNLELVEIEKDKNKKILADKIVLRDKQKEIEDEIIAEDDQRRAEADENRAIEVEKKTLMQEMIKNMIFERNMLKADEITQDKLQIDRWYNNQLEILKANQTDHATFLEAKKLLDDNYRTKKDQADNVQVETDKWRAKDYLKFASKMFRNLQQIFDQMSANKIAKLETEYEIQKQFIIDNVEDEAEREKQLEELEATLVAEKRKAAKASFLMNKASSMGSAIVNTANAVTSALKAPPPFNLILAGIVGAMGAVQIGLIAGQKMPAMAKGGMVDSPTQALIGEAGPEVVLPLERFMDSVGLGKDQDSGGSKVINLNISIQALDGTGLIEVVNNRIVPLIQEALNDEALLVNPSAVRLSQ